MVKRVLFAALISLFVSACATVGPGAIHRDRFDYNTAVSHSWKQQTLLNIVKLRYADMPLFMEVASIVSGYSLESSVNLAGTIVEGSSPGSLSLGGAGKYTDRPTITYAPITGAQFNKNFMTPIPPSAILFLLQAGWPADVVLPITLEAINGLRARKSAGAGQRTEDGDYYRVIQLFKEIQRSGAMGMRVQRNEKEDTSTVVVIRRTNVSPEIIAAGDELADLLGMRRNAKEYNVVYAEVAKDDTEMAMLTRSMLSIMIELAGQVDVPAQDVSEGRTVPSLTLPGSSVMGDRHKIIDIRHSTDRPDDAFSAVKYRGYWFWIDDRDFSSKRTLAYLMLLFSLTESGGKEGLPLVTIPAG
jgi:hypothetical protein